jgi:hypothetical protein
MSLLQVGTIPCWNIKSLTPYDSTGDCSLNVAHKLKGPGSVKFSETPGSYKCYSR